MVFIWIQKNCSLLNLCKEDSVFNMQMNMRMKTNNNSLCKYYDRTIAVGYILNAERSINRRFTICHLFWICSFDRETARACKEGLGEERNCG